MMLQRLAFITVAFTTCLGFAASENTSVVSLFIYGADKQSLDGSIVQTESDKTTYSINCPSGTNSSDCGVAPGLLYTEAPTTVQWQLQTPYDADKYGHVICSTSGTTTAVCTEVTPMNGSTALSSATTTLGKDDITLLAVIITGGMNGTSTNKTASSTTDNAATETSAGASTSSSSSGAGDTVPVTVPVEFFLGGLAVALVAIAL